MQNRSNYLKIWTVWFGLILLKWRWGNEKEAVFLKLNKDWTNLSLKSHAALLHFYSRLAQNTEKPEGYRRWKNELGSNLSLAAPLWLITMFPIILNLKHGQMQIFVGI